MSYFNELHLLRERKEALMSLNSNRVVKSNFDWSVGLEGGSPMPMMMALI